MFILKGLLRADKTFCMREGSHENYPLLGQLYQQASDQHIGSMMDLETMLTQILINKL